MLGKYEEGDAPEKVVSGEDHNIGPFSSIWWPDNLK